MPRALLIAVLLLLALATTSRAQQALGMPDPETTGRYYLLAFPDTTATILDSAGKPNIRDTFVVLIYSGVPNRAVFSGAGGYYREVPLEGGHFTTVYLNDSANRPPRIVCDVVDTPMPDVIRLETDEPVVVYCQMYTRFGGEGWTPIPVEDWGTEYYAIAPPGAVVEDVVNLRSPPWGPEYVGRKRGANAELLLIAAYDGTNVDVDRAGSIGQRSVLLNAGECFLIQGSVDTTTIWSESEDLSGTRLVSNHPIGVIAASTRGWFRKDTVPRDTLEIQNGWHGLSVEWLSPTTLYGTEYACFAPVDTLDMLEKPRTGYINRPWWSRTVIRMTTGERADIEILGVGDSSARLTISPRSVVDFELAPGSACVIRASRPISAHTISSSAVFIPTHQRGGGYCGCSSGLSGSSAELIPISQWSTFVPVVGMYVPNRISSSKLAPFLKHGDSARHFVVVFADSSSRDSVVWEDGSPFAFNNAPIHGTRVIWGRAEVGDGVERSLSGKSGARFSASMLTRTVGMSFTFGDILRMYGYWEIVGISIGYPLAPKRSRFAGSTDGVAEPKRASMTVTPNPFQTGADIVVDIPVEGPLRLEIFDMLGDLVDEQSSPWTDAGRNALRWEPRGLPRGSYVIRLSSRDWSISSVVVIAGE